MLEYKVVFFSSATATAMLFTWWTIKYFHKHTLTWVRISSRVPLRENSKKVGDLADNPVNYYSFSRIRESPRCKRGKRYPPVTLLLRCSKLLFTLLLRTAMN